MARRAEPLGRWAVAVVFLAAGLLKVWDPGAFALSVARLQILPQAGIGPAAILLPWVEIVAAGALFLGPSWRGAGRAVVAGLLVAFTAVLAASLARGGASACGCFGVEGGLLSRADVGVARNLLLLGLLVPGYLPPGRTGA